MFSMFNLRLNNELDIDTKWIKENNKKIKSDIDKVIERYIGENGVIDGASLEKEWFPDIKVDVFISHSHNDEEEAIKLAAWLYENFKLTSFIDSFVWGSSDKLLKKIDSMYCKQDSGYYDYEKRNFSTSHVHMMLSIALGKVMHKSETIIFLNTSKSISTEETINNSTYSPWIYSEIFTANIIEKIPPKRYKKVSTGKFELSEEQKSLSIKHTLELDKFIDLNYRDLQLWRNSYDGKQYPLDVLYQNKGCITKN